VPVINGLTNRTHPCQIMADVMTYEEHRGPIGGRKVVWCGDGNNVCASFLHAAGQFGFDFTFTGPETLDPEEKFVTFARDKGSKVTIQRDPFTAVEGADLVVTDTWVSMHDPESAKERRHNQLRPYQVNEQLMSRAKPDSLFMHCLPAHRNDEATSAVMDGPHSVIFDEAENRLHAQKALLASGQTVLEDNPYGPEPTPTYPAFWADGQVQVQLTGDVPLTCPVRLLHGQDDGDVPPDISLRLAQALCSQDVQVTLVKGGDHRLSREQDIALLLRTLAHIA
jgi:hypothetical protein